MTPINPQEIYLLERFISTEYFGELRDKWESMVLLVENCLEGFMRRLPENHRSRPLPEQPGVVWGERVLPNFRDTLRGLSSGFTLLAEGDSSGLHFAHGPIGDFKGQMDFWSGWMSKEDEQLYRSLLSTSTTMAGNICKTEGAYWRPLTLSNCADELGPFTLPEQWPRYRINKSVSAVSGAKAGRSGIYVPDLDGSCAEFISTKYDEAPLASVLVRMEDRLHPVSGRACGKDPVFEERSCVWYLVERVR